jgi:hypothetical protein
MEKTLAASAYEPPVKQIPVLRLRQFLRELANLRDDGPQASKFHEKFADILPEPKHLVSLYSDIAKGFQEPPSLKEVSYHVWKTWHIPMRNWVQSIWRAQDDRIKRWLLYPLVDSEMRAREGRAPILSNLCFAAGPVDFVVEPPGAFESALTYLLNPVARPSRCRNEECPAPYFFAARRNQRYCSNDCALPAQREHKRQWWKREGPNWRKRRDKRKGAKQ